jgi:hypothetical protein
VTKLNRQPEIEVYICQYSQKDLIFWMKSLVGHLEKDEISGVSTTYQSDVGPIIITPKVEGGPFTSIWFNTPNSPWETDVDCARQISKELACVVRCCPGKRFPEVPQESNIFLEISNGEERLVEWQ